MQSPHTNLSVMKLYILIQRFLGRKYVHYFVLFFILISIAAIIGSSYEEMAAYRLPLFGVTYVSSFVFLVEYIARILSAPALYPGRKAVKARQRPEAVCSHPSSRRTVAAFGLAAAGRPGHPKGQRGGQALCGQQGGRDNLRSGEIA